MSMIPDYFGNGTVVVDCIDGLQEQIRKIQDDICEMMMFSDTPKNTKLTIEEYLEQSYKL
jgi:hypothetical protein